MRDSLVPLKVKKGALCFYSIFNVDLWGIDSENTDKIWEKLNENCFFNSVFECDWTVEKINEGCNCLDIADEFHAVPNHLNTFYRKNIGFTWFQSEGRWFRLRVFVSLYPHRNLGIMYFNVCLIDLSVDEIIKLRQLFEPRLRCRMVVQENQWQEEDVFLFENKQEYNRNLGFWHYIVDGKFLPSKEKNAKLALKRGDLTCLCKGLIYDVSYCFRNAKKKESPSSYHRTHEKDVIIDDTGTSDPMIFNRSVIEVQSINLMKERGFIVRDWVKENSLPIYGLITGDEGYRYVPRKAAISKIGKGWGTRNFVYVFAYGNHVVLFNFKYAVKEGREYVLFEEKLNEREENAIRKKYFGMNCCVAGVDHGVGNCIERNMIVAYEYHYIVEQEMVSDLVFIQKRNKILTFLSWTAFAREEIEDLYDLISAASGTLRFVDLMRQRCVIQSEEKSLYNQKRNNRLIASLTIVSSILALLAVTDSSLFIRRFGYSHLGSAKYDCFVETDSLLIGRMSNPYMSNVNYNYCRECSFIIGAGIFLVLVFLVIYNWRKIRYFLKNSRSRKR